MRQPQSFIKLIVLLSTVLTGTGAFASIGLWDSNRILPAGRSAVSLSVTTRSTGTRLNSSGESESLGRISRQSIKDSESEETREFQVRMSSLEWTPTWAYGLLSNWTLLARLPIRVLRSSVSQVVSGNEDQQKTVISAFNERSNGRAPEGGGTYESTNIGQVQIRSLHRIGSPAPSGVRWTLSETLLFPTAEVSEVDFVTTAEPKAEGFGLGAGVQGQFPVGGRLDFFLGSEATHYFRDKVTARNQAGFPTSDRISRQPGLETYSRLGTAIKLNPKIQFSGGLAREDQQKSKYIESDEPLQASQKTERNAMFVAARYRADQVSAEIGWEPLLSGKNTEDADVLKLEIRVAY